ncbi:LacI family DNA-binding transcriptional regulator [Paenibacillus sp. IB182496]|uniref:LacI family DNA-binding transcriptional regulator n=1 Tax=Paenibacillus sabuli TaxID=2772509 RepID=A0A927BRF4_9BACL|nr:LacI family DNA-binding transcriptional regulator [Paenibacillus sabuli]MBD2844103.1 LacI family DNA-binding transcriptional regulator [Paenibacillus sabuli]
MATRQQVAERAGVSVAVVSYVLNNRKIVKEETRRKVLEAIRELGYRPNQTARSLKTKQTRQIAVLIHYIGNPFEAGLLLHIEATAKRHGYFIFVQTYEPAREEELRAMLIGRVDGVLLLGHALAAESLDDFRALGIPVVSAMQPADGAADASTDGTAGGTTGEAGLPSIDVDWQPAMRRLIRHLREQGHTRIAFMTDATPGSPLGVRAAAFASALGDEGLTPATSPLDGGGRFERARETLDDRLATQPAPAFTALVCANDLMAAGCLAACRDRGRRVPQELAIAGCEDILMSSQTDPPLTAIHYPRQAAGEQAMEMLLAAIAKTPIAGARLPGELIVRGSTSIR